MCKSTEKLTIIQTTEMIKIGELLIWLTVKADLKET